MDRRLLIRSGVVVLACSLSLGCRLPGESKPIRMNSLMDALPFHGVPRQSEPDIPDVEQTADVEQTNEDQSGAALDPDAALESGTAQHTAGGQSYREPHGSGGLALPISRLYHVPQESNDRSGNMLPAS